MRILLVRSTNSVQNIHYFPSNGSKGLMKINEGNRSIFGEEMEYDVQFVYANKLVHPQGHAVCPAFLIALLS